MPLIHTQSYQLMCILNENRTADFYSSERKIYSETYTVYSQSQNFEVFYFTSGRQRSNNYNMSRLKGIFF